MTDYEKGYRDALATAVAVVGRYLMFDSQRAVSYGEVRDACDAIRALRIPAPKATRSVRPEVSIEDEAPKCRTCGDTGKLMDSGPPDHWYAPCPDCGAGRTT